MASKNDMRAFVSSFADGLDDKAFALATLQAMIAAEISMRRQELKLSQKELAAMLGVSQGLVSRWEKGDANFTLSTLVAIASVLGLELQSPIQPSPIKHYRVGGSNIYQFNPSSWHSASFFKDMTTVTSVEADTELKEM